MSSYNNCVKQEKEDKLLRQINFFQQEQEKDKKKDKKLTKVNIPLTIKSYNLNIYSLPPPSLNFQASKLGVSTLFQENTTTQSRKLNILFHPVEPITSTINLWRGNSTLYHGPTQ